MIEGVAIHPLKKIPDERGSVMHMLRSDTSPVQKRLATFASSMPDVTFHACAKTIRRMAKKEGKEPPIVANAEVVPAGAVMLLELAEAGWTVMRP